jgi:hypothetical protein
MVYKNLKLNFFKWHKLEFSSAKAQILTFLKTSVVAYKKNVAAVEK